MDNKKLLKYSGLARDNNNSADNVAYNPSLNHRLYNKASNFSKKQFGNYTNGSERRKKKSKQTDVQSATVDIGHFENDRIRYENGIPSELRDEDGTYRPLHELQYSSDNRNSDLEWNYAKRSQKVFLCKYFCPIAVIFFFLTLYIPVYNQAKSHDCETNCSLPSVDKVVSQSTQLPPLAVYSATIGLSTLHARSTQKLNSSHKVFEKIWSSSRKASVPGWAYNTSRNTRSYVFPDNVTMLNQPKLNCKPNNKSNLSTNLLSTNQSKVADSNEIFLLVIICSSMDNFEARAAIRDTWGNQSNYDILSKKFDNITKYFASINVTDKLLTDIIDFNNFSLFDKRVKRDLTEMEDYVDNHFNENDGVDFDGASLADSLSNDAGTNSSELFSKILDINSDNSHTNSTLSPPTKNSNRLSSYKPILNNDTSKNRRSRRDVRFLNNDVIKNNIYLKNHDDPPETVDDPRFDHGENKIEPSLPDNTDPDNKAFSNFDENDQKDINFDYYDYQTEISNIMRIPPRGEKLSDDEAAKNVDDAKNLLRLSIAGDKMKLEYSNDAKTEIKNEKKPISKETSAIKIKFLFLLGQSSNENNTELQSRIDDEAALHGDVIQESFIDSYNNLTLKSVMLLKWAMTNCGNNVRYIMKTDDDMFINVPRLIEVLQNKSREHFNKITAPSSVYSQNNGKLSEDQYREIIKEKLLMGDLICDARPISDTSSKWYSPTYMYGGRVYPRYLSGTGYVMSYGAAEALYKAALDTPLFHLEDIYVTGMCSEKAGIKPIDNPGFSYSVRKYDLCTFAYLITAHQVSPTQIRRMHNMLMQSSTQLGNCELKRILSLRNTSIIASVKDALSKLPILGSPKSFINGLVGLGFVDGKITKLSTISTKKRKKANNGCF